MSEDQSRGLGKDTGGSSSDEEDTVFNIFKPGVKFDIIEEAEESSRGDALKGPTGGFLESLEYYYLTRNCKKITQDIEATECGSLSINEVETCCLHVAQNILQGKHIELFRDQYRPELQIFKDLLHLIVQPADFESSVGCSEKIRQRILQSVNTEKDPYLRKCLTFMCLLVGTLFLELYVQSNYTGPELSGEFYRLLRFPLFGSDEHSVAIAALSCDGECAFRQCDIPHALVLARCIISTISDATRKLWEHGIDLTDGGAVISKVYVFDNDNLTTKQASSWMKTKSVWMARSINIHLRVMQRQSFDSMPTLWKEAEDQCNNIRRDYNLTEFVDHGTELTDVPNEYRSLVAQLWLEIGLTKHYFDHGDKGKSCFRNARACANLKTELTAALGKRTKHQVTPHAQMYLYARSHLVDGTTSVVAKIVTNNEAVVGTTSATEWTHGKYEIGKRMVVGDDENAGEEAAVREVKLDDMDGGADENILLEGGAKFITDKDMVLDKGGSLHSVDQAILLAMCLDVQNSNPSDGLTAEEMFPYIYRVLEQPNNWMIHSTGLLERSWLEYEKRRTADRAILQIQALLDQHTTRLTLTQSTFQSIEDASPVQDRLQYVHSLVYPAQYELKRDLAYRYLQYQIFVSALNMFQELELWDEVVKCYQLLQKPHRAEMVVREQIKKCGETPYMLTALGDLTSSEEYYERAWTLSNGRFARAKRTLGNICFDSKRYTESVSHLDAALSIQPLVASAWYLRGLACMQLERWEDAILSFNRCVQQDMEIGEAWANIGAVQYHLGEYARALPALKEALKYKPNNWKILENLSLVTLLLGLFGESCMYISTLVDLRHASKQDVQITELRMLCKGILELDNPAPSATLLRNFENLMLKISNSYASDAEVWDVFAIFMFATNRAKQGLEYRFKQLRALVQRPRWEQDYFSVSHVMNVSKILVGEVLVDQAADNKYSCRSLLQLISRTLRTLIENQAKLTKTEESEKIESGGDPLTYDSCLLTIESYIQQF